MSLRSGQAFAEIAEKALAKKAFICKDSRDRAMDLLPGGYNFIHAVFWVVGAMVAFGTTVVANILAIGLVLLFLESVGKA